MPLKNSVNKKPGLSGKYRNIKKAIRNKLSPMQIRVITALIVLPILYLFRSSIFVAVVNGVPVTRIEFTRQLEQAIGKDTLENLITERLIKQEIKKNPYQILKSEKTIAWNNRMIVQNKSFNTECFSCFKINPIFTSIDTLLS